MHAEGTTERDLRGVVSQRTFQRGRAYARGGRVEPVERDGSLLVAQVWGSRPWPYEVEARLSDLDAWCGCPVGAQGRCKHVVAVVLAWLDEPGSFPSAVPEGEGSQLEVEVPEPPADLEGVRAWADEQGIAHLLEHRAADLATSGRDQWYWLEAETVRDLLAGEAGQHQQRRAREWLHRVAVHRAEALAFEALAEGWRATEPDDPHLARAWAGLRALRERLRAEHPPPHPDAPGRLAVHDDPPQVVYEGPLGAGALVRLRPVQVVRSEGYDLHAVDGALDLITDPERAEVRDRIAEALATPDWQRLLGDLDGAAAQAGPPDDEMGREFGWLLRDAASGWELSPVLCRPYVRKSGWRTWAQSVHTAQLDDLPRDADRVAVELLRSAEIRGGDGGTARALDALVGHPRVLLGKQGQPIAVRRGTLGLAWEPRPEGGMALIPTVDGRELPQEQLADLLARAAGGRLVWLEAEQARCTVVRAPEALRHVLRALGRRGNTVPDEAVPAFLERVEAWQDSVAITLRGELRGRRVEPDARPVFRLVFAPDGALEVEVAVRPLAGGPLHPPGEGPVEVSAVREGERVFVHRDRRAEVQAAEQALGALPVPDEAGWALELHDPERALGLVEALRELEGVRVEWRRDAPTLSRATPDTLAVHAARRRDWLGLEGGVQVDGHTVPLAELLAAVRADRRFVQVGERAWVVLSDALRQAAGDLSAVAWEGRSGPELSPIAAGSLEALEQSGATVEVPEACRLDLQRMREAGELEPGVPGALRAELRAYQQRGFTWLARMAHWSPGACLADDMGLGKTVQALALLLRRAAQGPALVVAPASVGSNWQREAARFAPGLDVRSYRGRDREALLDDLAPGQVLVTSWALLVHDAEQLVEQRFATVVLDEAQAIKNPSTLRSRAAARLDAGFVLALTGTPVENHVGELWSLFRAIAPGVLGSQERFRRRYAVPIGREADAGARQALARAIRPFLLRRTKGEVATDLPERTEIIERVALSAPERRLYETWRVSAAQSLEQGGEDEPGHVQILAVLTRLRQLACHPRLVHDDGPARSAKLARLVELVEELRDEGHRALVFSNFTGFLGLVREALEERGVRLLQLDGSVPTTRRQALVDAFQGGEADVFLISLKAGGTGLNLTAASYVIHLDPWFNPAAEDQASDRAHRIGQTEPVTVYRLIAEGTVEEAVIALHDEKRALVRDLLEGTGSTRLDTAELLALVRDGAVSATTDVARAHGASAPDAVVHGDEPAPDAAAQPAEPGPDDPAVDAGSAPDDPAVDAEPAPGDAALHARWRDDFDERMDEELASGSLAREQTARAYRRAVDNLLSFAERRGGAVASEAQLDRWSERYLGALESGEITQGRSDRVFGPAAWGRLRAMIAGPAAEGPG